MNVIPVSADAPGDSSCVVLIRLLLLCESPPDDNDDGDGDGDVIHVDD